MKRKFLQLSQLTCRRMEQFREMVAMSREILRGSQKPRTGWVNRGVPPKAAETIGEHSVKAALAALVLDGRTRLVFMLLVHDLPETPKEGVDYVPGSISPEEKIEKEKAILERLEEIFGPVFKPVCELIHEFEKNETQLVQIGHQLDKLDVIPQALRYALDGNKDMEDFFPYTRGKLTDKGLKTTCDLLITSYRSGELQHPYLKYFYLLLLLRFKKI